MWLVAFWSTDDVKTMDIGIRKNGLCPVDFFMTMCIQFHLKWLIDLNIKAETIKALEESIG